MRHGVTIQIVPYPNPAQDPNQLRYKQEYCLFCGKRFISHGIKSNYCDAMQTCYFPV